MCILCVVYLCFWYHKSFYLNTSFSYPPALLIGPQNCSCLFLMVLNRGLSYPVISITSSFDFFTVHDFLIIFLMYHISLISLGKDGEDLSATGCIKKKILDRNNRIETYKFLMPHETCRQHN